MKFLGYNIMPNTPLPATTVIFEMQLTQFGG